MDIGRLEKDLIESLDPERWEEVGSGELTGSRVAIALIKMLESNINALDERIVSGMESNLTDSSPHFASFGGRIKSVVMKESRPAPFYEAVIEGRHGDVAGEFTVGLSSLMHLFIMKK